MAQRATDRTGRDTLFVGVDTSGSFVQGGDYGNAISFLAYYIYGHLHGLGGLGQGKEPFVAPIRGQQWGEAQSFYRILDFADNDIPENAANLQARDRPPHTPAYANRIRHPRA